MKSEVVFDTEIDSPSQKLLAFKDAVLEPIIFDDSSFQLSVSKFRGSVGGIFLLDCVGFSQNSSFGTNIGISSTRHDD